MNEKRGPPLDGVDQVYRTDRWTRYQYRRHIENEAEPDVLAGEGAGKLVAFPTFVLETFGRLFCDQEEKVDAVQPEHAWAERAHEELGNVPDFDRLRRKCRGDRFAAGVAAAAFAKEIREKLPAPPAPLEDPGPLRQQIRGLLQFAKNLVAAGKDATAVEAQLEPLRERGQAAVRAATSYAEGLDGTELRNVLRSAVAAGHEAVDRVNAQLDAFCGWGTASSIEGQAVGAEVKAELARRVGRSSKLQALAREAGRLRRIAAAKQRSKAEHAREEISDIERGADLERLLPSELVKLTDPVLSLEFARGFCERALLQYRLSGKEPQGHGPIVICIDQSGSMEGAKEIWSKALALALLQIATTQRRHCRVVHFNGDVARVDDWPPGKTSPLKLLESMEPFFGGGTAFEPPLRKALEAIDADRGLKKADVVIVTDGEAELSGSFCAEWTAAKKRREFTCYAVHVDSAGGVAPRQLSAVADTVIGLADVASDAAATDAVLAL